MPYQHSRLKQEVRASISKVGRGSEGVKIEVGKEKVGSRRKLKFQWAYPIAKLYVQIHKLYLAGWVKLARPEQEH